MRFTRWNRPSSVLAVAGLALAVIAVLGLPTASAARAPGLPTAVAARVPGPVLKLEAAQRRITVPGFRGRVFLDPGIWLAALGSPLQFDVQRVAYTRPITITQVIHPPFGGTIGRPLPASVLAGWDGLKNMVVLTVRDSAGQVVLTKRVTFCPNSFDPERVGPGSPPASPYPTVCTFDPFQKGMVWGIQKDWAVNPAEEEFSTVKLPLGSYRVTESISPAYVKLFHVPAANATATVNVKVVKETCCSFFGSRSQVRARRTAEAHRTVGAYRTGQSQSLSGAAAVRTMTNPPRSALPDLVPLPAWSITVSHPRRQTHDYLDFAATVWVGGRGPLDVQGFRSDGSPVMPAWQYFLQNGHAIGRARAGTMGFDSQHGHNHWHFEQFARYALLNAAKSVAVTSHKVGFCIGPSDPVDLLLPHATWQPARFFPQQQCGSPTALWVDEQMPLGWGDTYFQSVAGQSFDITHVPNGTYYVRVTANPEKVLYETSTRNDVSLRKVILGGTPGHRTVKVPAWHGIDPEH
jgi:Lysyl oxidase